ncbi:MAG: Flp pilus assembly complex ATPase component TadA [Tissierellia bacterium]|nr:Flp pilus assembly complex ATPase component TadA [Tissierellia bacterium]
MGRNTLKLGELLLYAGKIDNKQFEDALEMQKGSNKKIGEILVEQGWVSANDIVEALEYQLGFPRVDLNKFQINVNVATLIPESIVRRHKLIAIDKKEDTLVVAMVDPLNFFAIDDIRLFTKHEVQPVLATQEEIERLIERFYSGEQTKKVLEEISDVYYTGTEELEEEEKEEVAAAPIVRLLNSIIEQAVRMRASDIHIEPYQDDIRVRFRIDGDLVEIMTLPRSNLSPIVTRVKIMGKMNIAEKRLPQDGRVEVKLENREIDLRISTLPTVHGEKLVLRLLDKTNFQYSKESLGLNKRNLEIFDKLISQPYGMILVTGPTGSGKSTTLYAILKELNTMDKNIITVEDPVEYKLMGINQVQVNTKAGLTFASGLRSILRQDPDIIMIGEIRDAETAAIAIRAAITGHLVLSTLHTNDSASTIARLVDMGIEPYMVSSAIMGVISQRLVKLLCPECKVAYEASYSEKKLLKIEEKERISLYRPVGCNSCNNGYRGRIAIHEIMPVNEDLRRLINSRAHTDAIRNKALEFGMITLFQSAIELALKGETSFDEVMKVGFTLG